MNTVSLGVYVLRVKLGMSHFNLCPLHFAINSVSFCFVLSLEYIRYGRLKFFFIERLSEEVILNKKKSLPLKAEKNIIY